MYSMGDSLSHDVRYRDDFAFWRRPGDLPHTEDNRRGRIDLLQVAGESRSAIPARRYADVAESASVAAFLASPRASYMTGGSVRVDGGMTRTVQLLARNFGGGRRFRRWMMCYPVARDAHPVAQPDAIVSLDVIE
jgi:hypothetical protein